MATAKTGRIVFDSFIVKSHDARNRIRLVIGPTTLVGALIMGDQSLAAPIMEMIRDEVDLGRFRQVLIETPDRSLEILRDFAAKAAQGELAYAG